MSSTVSPPISRELGAPRIPLDGRQQPKEPIDIASNHTQPIYKRGAGRCPSPCARQPQSIESSAICSSARGIGQFRRLKSPPASPASPTANGRVHSDRCVRWRRRSSHLVPRARGGTGDAADCHPGRGGAGP